MMADRSRRVRRQISDDISDASEESDIDAQDSEGEDYDPRILDAMRRAGRHE